MKRSEIAFGVLRIPVDFAAAFLGFYCAFLIRGQTDLIPGVQLPVNMPTIEEFMPFLLGSSLGLLVLFALGGLYSFKGSSKWQGELWRVTYSASLWIGAIVAYYFIIRDFFPSRLLLIYGWILSIFFLMTGRLAIRSVQQLFLRKGIGQERVFIIGKGSTGTQLEKAVREMDTYTVAAHSSYTKESWASVLHTIAKKHIDMVIVTSQLQAEEMKSLLETVMEHHVRLRFVPDVLELSPVRLESLEEMGFPMMEMKPSPLDGWGRVWKRCMDIVGATMGIIILSPLWIPTALAVWIQMGSVKEIIFKQHRYGQFGKLFMFYKFQSMYVGAKYEHAKLMQQGQGERKGLLKIENDPRVTPVGRFIRKTSLDELPQLWLVLKGDMSLVGPRPHMPEEVDLVSKQYKPLLHMKPGLTGLPQISGRSTLTFDDEMELDMYYLEHWSLWFDIQIIVKTIRVVLFRENVS